MARIVCVARAFISPFLRYFGEVVARGSMFTVVALAGEVSFWENSNDVRPRISSACREEPPTRFSMPPGLSLLIAKIRDAGVTLDAWSETMKSLTDALGVAGRRI
jgi:hypothetical protein